MARTKSSTIATPGPRRAYVVLGMHRSGTSAVTQLLALAGANLPQNVMPGDEHNAKGYFEPWKLALLNDERLRAGGSAWDDPFAFPYRAMPAKDEAAWIARGVEVFEEEYRGAAIPLLKDPRVSVLLPMWREVLAASQAEVRCVIPVRHPLAVARSLSRRDGFTVEKSVLLWTAYMLASEAYSRDLPRAVVGYDALLADWRSQAKRIEAAHGADLPDLSAKAAKEIDGFLTADLRHNTGADDLSGLGWIGDLAARVLAWFEAAARDESPDIALLDTAGAELARRREEYGSLVSPTARDLDATRSDLRAARDRVAYMETAQVQAFADERAAVEAGWKADIEQLTAEAASIKAQWEADVAQLTSEAAEIKAAWEADIAQQTAEAASIKAAWEADVAQLTAEAAEIKAAWEADVKRLTEQLSQEAAARQTESDVIAMAEAELDRILREQI